MSAQPDDIDFFDDLSENANADFLSPEEQAEELERLALPPAQEEMEPEIEEVDAELFDPQNHPPAPQDEIGDIHPLEAFQQLTNILEDTIQEIRIQMIQQPDPSWMTNKIAAIREIRMMQQNLMPHWAEYQSRQHEEEEDWVDDLMSFTSGFIRKEYGEDGVLKYAEAWNNWRRTTQNQDD